MPKMKEQEKFSEKELNEMEATKMPDAECKTMVIMMLKDLRGGMDKLSENLNKDTKNLNKNHMKEPVRNEECND